MKNRLKHPSSLLAIPFVVALLYLVYNGTTTLPEAGKFLAEAVAGCAAIYSLYHKSNKKP